MKRQPIEWKKMFANHIDDKGLITEYITNTEQNKQKKWKKLTTQFKKMG